MMKKMWDRIKRSVFFTLRLLLSVRRVVFWVLIIACYISGFRATGVQRIHRIETHFEPEGQMLIAKERLMDLIAAEQRILGTPISLVPWSQLEQNLKTLPQVKEVQFYLKQPHTVQIHLTFHKAYFYFHPEKDHLYYLNEQLQIMPLSPLLVLNLPIIHISPPLPTFSLTDSLLSPKWKPFAETLQFIAQDPFWSKWIADIVINPKGEVTVIPEIGEFHVRFGSDFTIANLRRLSLLLQHGLPSIEWKRVAAVDLRFRNQLVIRYK
jgi:hypothetical protein